MKQKVWLQLLQRMEGEAALRQTSSGNIKCRAAVALPAFRKRVAFAARPHVGVFLVDLEPNVPLERFGRGVLLDETFAEVAAAHGAKALQVPVIHIDLDVSLHAICTHQPEKCCVNKPGWCSDCPAAARRAYMSEHVCVPHGSKHLISMGNSSLQITHVKGGASGLNTPASAVSTAATATRLALANRCNTDTGTLAPAAALESLTDRWRLGGCAAPAELVGGAAGALRVRRTSAWSLLSHIVAGEAKLLAGTSSELARARGEELARARGEELEAEVVVES